MAARKRTFSIPTRERPNYVAEAVAGHLRKQDDALIRACEIASRDEDLLAIEREFDIVGRDIAEPWIDASKG